GAIDDLEHPRDVEHVALRPEVYARREREPPPDLVEIDLGVALDQRRRHVLGGAELLEQRLVGRLLGPLDQALEPNLVSARVDPAMAGALLRAFDLDLRVALF